MGSLCKGLGEQVHLGFAFDLGRFMGVRGRHLEVKMESTSPAYASLHGLSRDSRLCYHHEHSNAQRMRMRMPGASLVDAVLRFEKYLKMQQLVLALWEADGCALCQIELGHVCSSRMFTKCRWQ